MTDECDYEVSIYGYDFGSPDELVLARLVADRDYEDEVQDINVPTPKGAAVLCVNKLVSHKKLRIEVLPDIHVEVMDSNGNTYEYTLFIDFQCYVAERIRKDG